MWLSELGAEVYGLSLPPPSSEPNLFSIASVDEACVGRFVDVRDRDAVSQVVRDIRPDTVFHLAAQSIVLECLRDPVLAFETNVLGTAHLLDALRTIDELRAVLVATSDKVYVNDASGRSYQETDALGGADPYSASKAACEAVVAPYRAQYFEERGVAVATARAGNVIGGGDFAPHRLASDCVRAAIAGDRVILRRPEATRPWQHVFDCLAGYIRYAALLRGGKDFPPALNFGPSTEEAATARVLATELAAALGGKAPAAEPDARRAGADAPMLSINSDLARRTLDVAPRLSRAAMIRQTANWTKAWRAGEDMAAYSRRDLALYRRETSGVDGAGAQDVRCVS